jgi:hypothetical protein
VGPGGYSPEQDQQIAQGYKYDSTKPYGYLLGKLVAPDGHEYVFGVGEGGLWENLFNAPSYLLPYQRLRPGCRRQRWKCCRR